MGHSIEIDDDIYTYLIGKIRNFGESPSDILRRELGNRLETPITPTEIKANEAKHELSVTLATPEFLHNKSVVSKFLHLLGVAYQKSPLEFERVLSIQGRNRKYFAKSKQEIEASGRSTQPRQIPGSPYWVMTNSPTSQKKETLKDVLMGMGYSKRAIDDAIRFLGNGFKRYTLDDL